MTDIALCFELHQPFRLRRWPEGHKISALPQENLIDAYFDMELNGRIFRRACSKSYLPATQLFLELVRERDQIGIPLKLSLCMSGSFVEQCERFAPKVLNLFRELVDTGYVELLSETYYHSLASLFPENGEFETQVRMHQSLMERLFEFRTTTFQNTEMIYSNEIARRAEEYGFKGIYTEGAERILGENLSANFTYRPSTCQRIKILLRNYKLTDDIGFRFSLTNWPGWPLTADKYAKWLSSTPGDCISIFMDFETIGEHHWAATGIFDFFRHLPHEIGKHTHLAMMTPNEIIEKHKTIGVIDVPDNTPVSWADLERDTSAWLSNGMQLEAFRRLHRLEPYVRDANDPVLTKLWRYLQASDHIYYMSTKRGGSGEVHSYFSPFPSAQVAYDTFQRVISDIERRVGAASHANLASS